MGGSQCFSELCGPLARLELDDEALAGSYCERKITLRQAKCLARSGDRRPKLLRVIDSHLTDREDIMVSTIMGG